MFMLRRSENEVRMLEIELCDLINKKWWNAIWHPREKIYIITKIFEFYIFSK